MNRVEHHHHGDQAPEPGLCEARAHWHLSLRAHLEPGVCERCGTNEHVHEGLCRRCRKLLLGKGTVLDTEDRTDPHSADVPPLHSPPWQHRGA